MSLRSSCTSSFFFFSFIASSPPAIYTLSLHDALPICALGVGSPVTVFASNLETSKSKCDMDLQLKPISKRSEEHTSELQSPDHLVCRLLLEKKKKNDQNRNKEIYITT